MRTARFINTVALLVLPSFAFAQSPADSTPRAGQWGAEGSLAGSTLGTALLRFRSPTSAWVVGADFSVARSKTEFGASGASFADSRTQVSLSTRLGLRSYRQSDVDRLRPIIGGGVFGSVTRGSNDSKGWRTGLYGELGATYFVAPHVSLGATGEVRASYEKDERESGTGQRSEFTMTSFGASLARVLVSVYF